MLEKLELESAFVRVMDTVPDAIILADQKSCLVHVNNVLCKMFGYSHEELIGKPIDVLMPDKYTEQHHALVEGYFADLRIRPMGTGKTLYAKDKTGREFPVEISLSPMETDQEAYVIAAIRDVSDRVRAQQMLEEYNLELLQSNQDLEQYAYVASHDLQEPLRIITSFTQLLEKRYKNELGEEGREFVDYIVDASHRMKMLISDLLAYSRLNQQHNRLGNVALQEVFGTVLDNLKAALEESGAIIEIENLPRVYGDTTQLVQLFQNLISNAIKFVPPHVVPEIRVWSEKADEDTYEISVRDNGIGIETRHQDRIFSLFQRLHSREEFGGTGIGLTICKRIVDRHKGEITVESEPGKGSAFRVKLHAAKSDI